MAFFAPRVFPEILADMLAALLASTPLTDVSFGGVLVTMLEAAAQEDDEQYFQMLQLIRAFSLDTTTGTDLETRAFEFGLTRADASNATTSVIISDSAITKVSTTIFSGLSGQATGSTTVNGDTLTGFSASGSIIVGRGKASVETVVYTSITDNGNFVTFNLSTAFANDHGTDETIILSQGGNRLIPSGTALVVPASDTTENVNFTTDDDATILDGEEEITDVPVTASEAGTSSNVPIGSIITFDSKPFATVEVTNPERVTNGRDEETDQELRDRIKDRIQSLSRGTGRSIITGAVGLVAEDVNKRVVSVSLRDTTNPADVVKLFIDDGTGFIPVFQSIGFEEVISVATGGEKFLFIDNIPVIKAFIETESEEPFNILNNTTLFVEVNGQVETITFTSSDFEAPGAGTAQEVLTKINANAILFESRVSSSGSKVKIFSRSSNNEEIQVTGGTANTALDFPTDLKFTTKLFRKRDNILKLLSKDGRTAVIESGSVATYDFSNTPVHLSVVVDGKIENIVKVWFETADFVIPTAANLVEITGVINNRVVGYTSIISSNDTKLTLESNIKRSSNSKMRVVEKFTNAFNEEGGGDVDRTTEFGDDASTVVTFAANLDFVHLGHTDVPFDSVFVEMSVVSSADILPNFEYFRGAPTNAFVQFGVHDTTEGMTQNGHFLFAPPHDWAKTNIGGISAFWLRIQRTELVVPTPPTTRKMKVCGANDKFNFSETEDIGTDKDYTLNRFVGQIELEETLLPNDNVTLGSIETRAFLVSTNGTFAGLPGATLTITVDGILQVTTFIAGDFADPLAALPTEVAFVINRDILGITATAIEGNTKVRIETNKFNDGTLLVGPLSANTVLDFSTILVESFVSHIGAIESTTGPYVFDINDIIVVVVDDQLSNSFTTPLFKESALTGATSASILLDTTISTTFPNDDDFAGFDLEMIDGTFAGERRLISTFVVITGTITLATPLGGTPSSGDKYQIIPKTTAQVVSLWNNNQVTLLTNSTEIRAWDAGRRVQLASLNPGEDGSISVTGGTGNDKLLFPLLKRGVDGYKHFTGLAQLVQKTVDGVQDDAENFPGIRAAGVQVEVIEPVKKPQRVDVDITTTEGVSISTVTDNVKSAISNYVNRRSVGEDVILSDIIVQVKSVDGIADAEITFPLSNVAIADNELARINETDIGVV